MKNYVFFSFLIGIFLLTSLNNFLFGQDASLTSEDLIQEETAENPLREAERAFTFTNDPEANLQVQGTSTIGAIFRMVLVLALVAAAIYGVVYFLKRKTASDNNAKDPFLKVLANTHLGNNRYAHIVSVGKKAWLLGSSDGGVNLIGEIDDKELIDTMLLEDSQNNAELSANKFPDFMTLLKKFGVKDSNPNQLNADELRRRREKLRQM